MKLVKVAAGTLNQTPLDWEQNRKNIIDCIREADKQNVSLLCLPELCITGYGCDDAFYSTDLIEQAKESLNEIVLHTSGIIVSVGLPVRFNNKIYNTSCLIANKRILGFVCKQHLPNYGVFYEDRWFHRWPAGVRDEIEIDEFKYPIGDLVFDLSGVRIGFEICEDAWVANRPGRTLFDRGVDIILNPSASPFSFAKFITRERFVIDGSRSFACSYIYTNLLGNESGRLIFDGDAMIASDGNLLVSSPRFGYGDFYVTSAVIDIEGPRVNHSQIKSSLATGNWKVAALFDFPDIRPVANQHAELERFERGGYLKEEEFARAVSLALFDYLRKSHSQGFTVSLSGGADSCACVALCGLMIRLADESIGLDAFKKKLSYIKKIQPCTTVEEVTKELIHSIYQGTENSSTDTFTSAESLANSIGATFYNVNINGLVDAYTGMIEEQIGRNLSWETDDLALQNIQARVRAPGVWLLANLNNHLLLATSNRSEVAVGYCTMDGDTAGSINPISGIEKFWLRGWLVWLETVGCDVKGRHIRIEGLNKVNNLQPTAELRPLDKKQTDEKDLMPYEVLNEIEKVAIRDKKPPLECLLFMEAQFADRFDRDTLAGWVERFFRLWSRNQWKRERYAPGFHLDTHNLDPRSWCRFPILSGGFEKELTDMQEYLAKGDRKKVKGRIGF
ncbi:NAD(+) synthase [Emticicia sp. TH156]|uniref:NAD(+) synthase n=1 Tax=Emticicia sp. TH156 TaxID=2067454 RepID=UPI000C7700D0|nr:NAD(+) synthase [Emticicia sp. TH156]PLK43504.1 NAD(+) synthase [Emticicia sp. TH156]